MEGAILALKRRWSGVEYDLLDRNCGHFCNELCQALGVGRMPCWVTRVAETMALMPGSHTLKNSISRAIMEDQGEQDLYSISLHFSSKRARFKEILRRS